MRGMTEEMPDGQWFFLYRTNDRWEVSWPKSRRSIVEDEARKFVQDGHEVKIAHIAFTSIEDFDG